MSAGPKKVIAAPTPDGRTPLPASSVSSVRVNPNEEVRWIWTHTPEGSHVSGYTIEKKVRPGKKPRKTRRR